MSKIKAGTTTTTAYQVEADTTGTLVLQTGSTPTTAVTIDGSQNVGIGTISPQSRLHVSGTTSRPIVQATNATGNADIKYISANRTYVVGVNTAIAAGEFAVYDDTAGATRMVIDSSGNLLVGTTSRQAGCNGINTYYGNSGSNTNVSVVGDTAGTAYHWSFYRGTNAGTETGSIRSSGSTTSYVTSSDYRLKDNVQPMTGALAVVANLKPCTYTWKSDGVEGQGFIAHELQAVVPDAVSGEKDAVNEDGSIKPQGIDTSFLVATLTAAIQELKAIVDAQREELDAAKADIATLKGA